MKITFTKYPIDVIICITWSIVLVPIILLSQEKLLLLILSIPLIFFIPGYLLISTLFPINKKKRIINHTEKLILSIGLSITIIPLIGFILNYSSWGLRLESILISLIIFVISAGFIAILKWYKITPDERYTISIDFPPMISENKFDKILTILIIISLIMVGSFSAYIVMNSQKEPFTEFYLFGPTGKAEGYPTNLTMEVNSSVILEIDNHEYHTIQYTIDIFLVNESTNLNSSENTDKTILHNIWFLHKYTKTLDHTDTDVEKQTTHQWQYNYSFAIKKTGSYKLAFLLNTRPTDNYVINTDIKNQKNINNYSDLIQNYYRELHLWIDIYDRRPIANFTFSPNQPSSGDIINFTDNSTTPYSKIAQWQWDFGDGNTSSGEITGLKFDGITSYVDCGTNTSLQPTNGTIEAWMYIENYMERRTIFTGSNQGGERRHPLFALSNNYLVFVLNDNYRDEAHTYFTGFQTHTWYHAAVTWDGYHVTFYVNGSLKQTDNQSFIPAGNTDMKRIGALAPPYQPEVFHGSMKDLRIYNRTLNSTEIQTNYLANVTTNGLVSWWKMNDGGNIIRDSIDNNDGIIQNGDWVNQAKHRYSHPGTYNITLKVINDYGQTHSIIKNITVV